MLIRYSIENFLSFKNRAELSLIPSKVRSLKHHKILGKNKYDIDVLKTAVLYGANASGKSNLIKSIYFAKKMIIEGIKPDHNILVTPFKLHKESLDKPSRFEFEFKKNNKNYAYGFILNNEFVLEEWLYQVDKRTEKKIFERKKINNFDFSGLRLDREEKQFLEFIGKGTRDNQLFLTECKDRNLEKNVKSSIEIIDTITWFQKDLYVIFPDSKYGGIYIELNKNENFKNTLNKYLKHMDTGIEGIVLNEIDFKKIVDIPDEIKNDIISKIKSDTKFLITNASNDKTYSIELDGNGNIKAYKLQTKHKMASSTNYSYFELNEESDGTQRLIDLIPAIIDLIKNNKVVLIDELNRSLHPLLSNHILDLFFEESDGIKSQLIVTTHESSLLNLKKIRKDEIWFIEKNKLGESSLFSLEEFQPRFDKEIMRNYLLGRFGGVPNLKKL
ncbi:MAG: ATP/GTP-binding protein [Rhodothermaceae bacterium]